MLKVVTAAQMREIDRLTAERYSVPSLLLMEAAANSAAREIASLLPGAHGDGRRVLVACGRGNNGGDGAALARILWTAGARVEVLLFGRVAETRGDARTNFEIVRALASAGGGAGRRLTFSELAGSEDWAAWRARLDSFDVLVDALLGTGLTRPLGGIFREVAADLSAARERLTGDGGRPLIVSLDLPSGLDSDSAEPPGEHVRADLTVTFTAPKPANVLPPASHASGRLVVAGIGSPAPLVEEAQSQLFLLEARDARAWLRQTRYAPDSYKNTHGHALILAGSRGMTGAAVLCAGAAMRAGAGLVTLAAPASALPAAAARLMPEVITAELAETPEGSASSEGLGRAEELAARADVIALGPGLTTVGETRRLVRELVGRRTRPLVIDADGLNALAPWPADLRGTPELPLILTPHPGEMRRLTGGAAEAGGGHGGASRVDRVSIAREFAAAHGVILVLKGARVLVAAPDGRVFVNPTGNAGLGTAGSGDTLTGIIAGFLAQAYGTLRAGADPLSAVLAAVYVGGAAGDLAARARGMRTMVASDVREQIGAAIREQLGGATDEDQGLAAHERFETEVRGQLGAAVRALDPEGERPR